MNESNTDAAVKKAKNIAAILFLLFMTFLVGGSYLDQQRKAETAAAAATADAP